MLGGPVTRHVVLRLGVDVPIVRRAVLGATKLGTPQGRAECLLLARVCPPPARACLARALLRMAPSPLIFGSNSLRPLSFPNAAGLSPSSD